MICGQNWDTEDEKSGRNGDFCPTWFTILKQWDTTPHHPSKTTT